MKQPVGNSTEYPLKAMEGAEKIYPKLMALYDSNHGDVFARQVVVIQDNQKPLYEVVKYLQDWATNKVTMYAVANEGTTVMHLCSGQLSKKQAKKFYAQINNLLCKADMQNEYHEFSHFKVMVYGGGEPEEVRVFEVTELFVSELKRLYPVVGDA